ncbi:Proteasome/cyclosome repeat family protein [Tritrichomonas foetus]|uniref:Proteasome/cyclosome repeat family protein n=1 Tax=Tritrichomonas foetus TaxID=1144522 RepID=A0A1J4JFQ6_9EUKA|nr:Proteasome/cyclosome repeat family protein [Tritrichomonas foetus]|eukprot:OHS96301.1 Proteasome/cyclosome repeat family protein [Tritrichomonas foetus]
MWGKTLGLLSLLSEDDTELQSYALTQLDLTVSVSWPQIADNLGKIKSLAKNKSFFSRKKAALLASKVTYHLGELDSSLKYALLAENLFNLSNTDEFTSQILSYAIKKYVKAITSNENIDENHFNLVKNIIINLMEQQRYSDVLCLSIETRLLDFVQASLEKQPSLASKAISLTLKSIGDFHYKQSLLNLFVDFSVTHSDKFQLSQLYLALQDSDSVAALLTSLMAHGGEEQQLLAFQIAFELAENAHQQFRANVINNLPQNLTADLTAIASILQRTKLLKLYLEFLFKRNHSDIQGLITLKDTFDTMRPLVHTSVVLAYALMYAGTADDNFYRNNTPWFTNAKKWAQFTTAAAVGVIHIGHLRDALKILDSFLRPDAPEYVLGGALYALGLIFVNYSWNPLVIQKVKSNLVFGEGHTAILHGACLSLGLISMGSRNMEHYSELQRILYRDLPEPGEAAGYAMGMVMLGSGLEFGGHIIDQMFHFANTTEHEKIMRGIAMGLAFVMYGREAEADPLVEKLLLSQNPLMRESAMWVTALAHVGTASNQALQCLLHVAVSDVNDNVRRAAVIGVGFVLSRSPHEVPAMVDLLAKSYHPHIRSGSALALGIACAGTGMKEAIDILKPLLDDPEDAVMQSALIAMGMVMQQQSDSLVPQAEWFRTYLRSMISRRRNDMQIFGLCTACGILNAGGGNVVISCNSLRGENSVAATVGLALFCNHFFWHPLALMLSLAFHPTAIIGLDRNLEVVDWKIRSNASPSTFAYLRPIDVEREQIILNDPVKLSISQASRIEEESEEEKEEETEEEPQAEILPNMSRVTLRQLDYVEIDESSQYRPVTGKLTLGFVMLKKV